MTADGRAAAARPPPAARTRMQQRCDDPRPEAARRRVEGEAAARAGLVSLYTRTAQRGRSPGSDTRAPWLTLGRALPVHVRLTDRMAATQPTACLLLL